jgi:pimeloyl-ACP methyl ester carboxylesterase
MATAFPGVTWSDGRPGGCDDQQPAPALAYTFVYPTDLGTGGTRHPIITWGNGTSISANATCSYRAALERLASRGFVIVAANSGSVGDGKAMLSGADLLVQENADPSSLFYGKLDTTRIGAVGHSQGAGGAVNATLMSAGRITSVVALAFTSTFWWWVVGHPVPDTAALTAPVLFLRGAKDRLATEAWQQSCYDGVSGAAVKASLVGAGHNDLSGASGYVTAWLQYTLAGDSRARGAFVGRGGLPPEILTNAAPTGPWQGVALKNLP